MLRRVACPGSAIELVMGSFSVDDCDCFASDWRLADSSIRTLPIFESYPDCRRQLRALCQLSYPWMESFELVPGAGVEPA
jgi:hypothetical protein